MRETTTFYSVYLFYSSWEISMLKTVILHRVTAVFWWFTSSMYQSGLHDVLLVQSIFVLSRWYVLALLYCAIFYSNGLKILFYNVFHIIMILVKVIDYCECAKKNQSFIKFSLHLAKFDFLKLLQFAIVHSNDYYENYNNF